MYLRNIKNASQPGDERLVARLIREAICIAKLTLRTKLLNLYVVEGQRER